MVSSGRRTIVCILLLLTPLVSAQSQDTIDKATTSTISGKVTVGGKGLPGVVVALVISEQYRSTFRPTRFRSTTDEDGSYRITNVPGLTFTLAQGGALVRGEITLAEGQTLPNALSVYLVPAEAARAEEALRYFASPVSTTGNFWLNSVMPGRYWILAQPATDDTRTDVSELRLPDAAELRSLLRHAAEQKKTEIELKPCQDITFKLPL